MQLPPELQAPDRDIERAARELSSGSAVDIKTYLEGIVESNPEQALKDAILQVIRLDNNLVKSLSAFSKKQLTREVVRLRAVVKVISSATEMVKPGTSNFKHAEAFCLMHYVEDGTGDPQNPDEIYIWNSRDGVTPYAVHIYGRRYTHKVPDMRGPYFDDPGTAQFKWVTRSPRLMMQAWRRTLDKMVAAGKFTREKADHIWNDKEAAASWNYNIGIVDLITGRFTDEEKTNVPAE